MDKEPEVITPIVEEVSDMRIDETIASTSQVNLLANLIRWVSVAKKEIGIEQLSVFLDVYAICCKLSEEMKVIILHLAEVATYPVMDTKTTYRNELSNDPIALCMEINSLSGQLTPELRDSIRRLTELIIQQSFRLNKADTWSHLLLELHGILTGGGTLQRLFTKNGVKEEKIEEDKVEENQAREDEIADSSSEDSAVSEHLEETPDNPTVQKGLRPARLRLVLPIENGSEQELDLGSFFIETDSSPKKGNGHKKLSLPKR